MKSLSQRQKALIRRSFSRAACCHPKIAQCFFDRLFALDPTVEPLFPSDFNAHKRKLMPMLALLVSALDQPDRFAELSLTLTERHLRYGVKPQHYHAGREALLWALEQNLGRQFTPPVRDAWSAFYGALLDDALSVEGK
jgi:hemoglobin-like flavoprotein